MQTQSTAPVTAPAPVIAALETADNSPSFIGRSAWRVYSDVLQAREDTIRALLSSRHGLARIFDMFLIVTLIAGLGVFLGVPAAMRQPTLPEQLDQFSSGFVGQYDDFITRTVTPLIVSGRVQELPRAVAQSVQRQLGEATRIFSGVLDSTTQIERLEDLMAQAGEVTEEQIIRVLERSPLTPEQLSLLLSRANLTDAQVDTLLSRTSITRAQLDAARQSTKVAVDAATAKLQPVLDSIKMTPDQLRAILAGLELTPQQLDELLTRFGMTPEQLAQALRAVEASPEQLEKFVADLRVEAVKLEPPIGTRASRIVNLAGQWLSTPLRVAAGVALFALALMLVAKALGGSATLPQHLGAVALAAAPIVLATLDFAPANLSGGMSVPIALAIRLFGRVLALIALVWAGVILIKSLSVAHGFSAWRSVAAIALTATLITVITPLAALLAASFVLRP